MLNGHTMIHSKSNGAADDYSETSVAMEPNTNAIHREMSFSKAYGYSDYMCIQKSGGHFPGTILRRCRSPIPCGGALTSLVVDRVDFLDGYLYSGSFVQLVGLF